MDKQQETIVSIQNMSCQVGSHCLLQQIQWEVKRGENWIVFGMNGCGKTTLLSIIAGYRSHTAGNVQVFGQSYSNDNVLALRKRIGWVSGSFFDRLYSREAVLDIVLSGVTGTLSLNSQVRDATVIRAKALLEQLQVAGKIYATFDTLSKGERQKVLLARALLGRPALLLLDEPGTGLDLASRENMLQMIDEMAQDTQMTILYVTHHVEEIPPQFDQCLLLRNGRIVDQLSVQEAFQDEPLSDFLEYPLLLHQHRERRFAQRAAESWLDMPREGW